MNGEHTNGNASSGGPQGLPIDTNGKKTKRYSKRIIVVFILAMGLLIAAITMQAQFKLTGDPGGGPDKTYRPPPQAGFTELATSMKRDRRPVQVVQNPAPEPEREPQRIVIEESTPALPQYYSNRDDAQAANILRTLRLQALTAKPVVEDFNRPGGAGPATSPSGAVPPYGRTEEGDAGAAANPAAMAALLPQSPPDPNGQTPKEEFLRGKKGGRSWTPQGYAPSVPLPRQFPYELKAGTIVPCVLQLGIVSDLPGNTMALVSENVWDASGQHILIPKGTKALGVYNSDVTFGQRRVQVVWNRLIFPNGTTLDITGSDGVDQAGYAGLPGRVDEHWGAMFKAALLASVFVAGSEILYEEDAGGFGSSESKSPRDVAAESLAGSIVDMGTKLTNRAADIQPTIAVQPGKRMNIFLTQDYAFPLPYF